MPRSRTPTLLWVLGALLMMIMAAVIVSAALVIAADGELVETSVSPADEVTEAAPAAPATSSGTATIERTPDQLAQTFAAAWSDGDWSTLAELSSPSAVEVARAWYVDGLVVTVVQPVSDQGGELLVVDPASPPGLIFNLRLDADGTARSVTELGFAGDAGDSGAADLGGPTGAAPPPVTTQPLTIIEPATGGIFTSGSTLRGTSTSDKVEYRLSASGIELLTGSIPVVDGTFEAVLDFTNTCCIEMNLRVSHPDGSSAAVIPLAYPEPG